MRQVDEMWEREPIVASEGDKIKCPGCGCEITYSMKKGWEDQKNLRSCDPPYSTHSAHIDLILVRGSNSEP
jgi:hypothetical protein